MPSTVPFSLDTALLPFAADLFVYTNDNNQVVVVLTGLNPSDTVSQAVFTAKLNPTDLDTAPTTVQKIATSASGLLVALSKGAFQFTFPLTFADELILLAPHTYDVKAWVNGAPRTIQTGKITTAVGVTSLTAVLPPVGSVVLSPSPAIVTVGQTLQLSAAVKDAQGNPLLGTTIVWSSSNPSVASVNPSTGLVTGLAAGNATITATANGVSANVVVQVSGLVYTP